MPTEAAKSREIPSPRSENFHGVARKYLRTGNLVVLYGGQANLYLQDGGTRAGPADAVPAKLRSGLDSTLTKVVRDSRLVVEAVRGWPFPTAGRGVPTVDIDPDNIMAAQCSQTSIWHGKVEHFDAHVQLGAAEPSQPAATRPRRASAQPPQPEPPAAVAAAATSTTTTAAATTAVPTPTPAVKKRKRQQQGSSSSSSSSNAAAATLQQQQQQQDGAPQAQTTTTALAASQQQVKQLTAELAAMRQQEQSLARRLAKQAEQLTEQATALAASQRRVRELERSGGPIAAATSDLPWLPRYLDSRDNRLLVASQAGDTKEVRRLLELGADPDYVGTVLRPTDPVATRMFPDREWRLYEIYKTRESETSLKLAASHGHKAVVRLLADAKADVNLGGGECGQIPLWDAIACDKAPVVRLLLKLGADIKWSLVGWRGYTALHFSAISNTQPSGTIVRALLEAKAAVNGRASDPAHPTVKGLTPLLLAAKAPPHMEMVRWLLEANADVNLGSGLRLDGSICGGGGLKVNPTPLHWAVQEGCSSLVKLLLKAKAQVNVRAGFERIEASAADEGFEAMKRLKRLKGMTPLLVAVQQGNKEIVQWLLEANADVSLGSGIGFGSLHWVLRGTGEHQVGLRTFWLRGELDNPITATPLHWAAIQGGQGCTSVVKLLLDAKAEVNATDGSGRTPLDAAYDYDREEVVRVLEAAGGVCKKDPEKGWEEETKCK